MTFFKYEEREETGLVIKLASGAEFLISPVEGSTDKIEVRAVGTMSSRLVIFPRATNCAILKDKYRLWSKNE